MAWLVLQVAVQQLPEPSMSQMPEVHSLSPVHVSPFASFGTHMPLEQ